MGKKRDSSGFNSQLIRWLLRQSKKVQASLAAIIVVGTLMLLGLVMHADYFFVSSQVMYTIGLLLLVYKLVTHKNCSGLSLITQEVTAIVLLARLIVGCANEMELDLHIVLDSVSLISTLWVIYMMRLKLQSTHIKELDNMPIYYLVVPCFVLALFINPASGMFTFPSITSILWAFCIYLESVSVLPQLRYIQNAKMVEPFTAHYVFALGIARLFSFAHWVFAIYMTRGRRLLLTIGGRWYLWIPMNLLAEIVQTFILADFCYYYIKSVMRGQQMVLPSV